MNNQNRPPFLVRMQQFMYGRNGIDKFNIFLIIVYLILLVINIFAHSLIISLIQLLVLAYIIFRFLSKNIYSRQRESAIYSNIERNVKAFITVTKDRIKDRKTHVYKKCPTCKKYLRLPKRKGQHTVKCPGCSTRFDVKI